MHYQSYKNAPYVDENDDDDGIDDERSRWMGDGVAAFAEIFARRLSLKSSRGLPRRCDGQT